MNRVQKKARQRAEQCRLRAEMFGGLAELADDAIHKEHYGKLSEHYFDLGEEEDLFAEWPA